VIYAVVEGDEKPTFEKYLVIAWDWTSNRPPSPLTLTHLPTVRPTKHLFQIGEAIGYAVGGNVYDLDGCLTAQVKLENAFREDVAERLADWQRDHKTEMQDASKVYPNPPA
jgi:hypothetical protein